MYWLKPRFSNLSTCVLFYDSQPESQCNENFNLLQPITKQHWNFDWWAFWWLIGIIVIVKGLNFPNTGFLSDRSTKITSSRLKSTFLVRVFRSFTNFLGSLTCILWSGIHNPIFDRVCTSPWHPNHQKIYTPLEVWVIPTQPNCFLNHECKGGWTSSKIIKQYGGISLQN